MGVMLGAEPLILILVLCPGFGQWGASWDLSNVVVVVAAATPYISLMETVSPLSGVRNALTTTISPHNGK